MKTLSKKNLLVVFLSFVFALSMVAFASTVKPVKAEGESVAVAVQEEAQLRIGLKPEEFSGIRFRVKVDSATKDAVVAGTSTLGFLITPKFYFDKAIEGKEDLQAIDYLDTTTGLEKYVGTDGVGIIVKGTEGQPIEKKFYPAEDGYYYANAAVENIKGNNLNLEFTMIAYLKTGEDVDYFLPSNDFARAYLPTASKAYINGDFDLGVVQQSKDVNLQTFGTGDNPVKIVDSEDLYAISETSAAEQEAYKGSEKGNPVFELVNNVAVDYDFAPIETESFKGKINGNGKKVTVYNNKELGTSIFDDKNESVTVDNQTKLFNASERAGDLFGGIHYADDYMTVNGYITKDEIDNKVTNIVNAVNYDGDAIEISIPQNDKTMGFTLIPAYTKDELGKMENINSVRFSFMTSKSILSNCTTDLKFETSLVALCGIDMKIKTNISRGVASSSVTVAGEWRTVTVTKEDFLDAYDTDTTIAVWGKHSTAGEADFYIGDIELLEEVTLYPAYRTARSSFAPYDPVITDAEGTVVSSVTKTTVYTATSHRAFVYVKPELANTTLWNKEVIEGELPNSLIGHYRLPALASYNSINGSYATFKEKCLYAKLNYTKSEILGFADKYSKVKITYMIDSLDGNGITELYHGALNYGQENANKWITLEYTIEEFVQYLGINKFEYDGKTYSTADLMSTDDYLFLGLVNHSSSSKTKVRMYLAGVEFAE